LFGIEKRKKERGNKPMAKKDFSATVASAIITESQQPKEEQHPEGEPMPKPHGARVKQVALVRGEKPKDFVRFNLWLDADQVKAVKAIAYADETKESEVFRQALEEYLAKPDNQKKVRKWGK
jgi:hypothetical protein